MKVVIPFTPFEQSTPVGPRGLTRECEAFGKSVGARFVDVSGSDFAYYELMRDLWHEGETFIYVEHDVVPVPELLPEMWACREPHCRPGLSCDPCGKLGADLMRRWPNLIEEMGQTAISPPSPGPIHWGSVTLVLASELARRGADSNPHDHPYAHPGNGVRI